NEAIITALIRISKVSYGTSHVGQHGSLSQVGAIELFIPMPEELMQQEKVRLKKEEIKLQEQIQKALLQLQNPSFIERAPPELVAKHTAQLEQQKKELQQLQERLRS